MIFQVLSPIVASIVGDSLKEAIKNFVKVNYANQFRNFVIADQVHKYNANINYYKQNNKSKIGINITPTNTNELTMYTSNSNVQPIYQESENGKPPQVVASGITLPIRQLSIPVENTINVRPIVTAPNMISTTDCGIVVTPNLRFLSNLF